MNDRELDSRLRDHFEAAASRHPPPDFDVMLGHAENPPGAHRRRRWGIVAAGALAASLAVAVVLERRAANAVHDDALLVAQLSASTYWTAPSDRWLEPPHSSVYYNVTRFGDTTFQMEEVKTWF